MTTERAEAQRRAHKQKRRELMRQIAACRREVARWPAWMRQERTVPAWMANHATDL